MPKKGYGAIKPDDDDDDHSTHPAKSANYLSLFTFWWMNSTFRTGNKRPLNQSDFLPLNEEDRTRDLTERLKDLWNYEVHQCSTTPGEQPKLWKCLLRMLSYREMIFLLIFWFLESIFLLLVPLGLGLLLSLLTATELNRPLIYGCCLFIGMAGAFSATTHYSAFKSDVVGMRFAAAIRGIIYKKILSLTQQSRMKTTAGNIMDLLSNDCQRIEYAPRMTCISFFFVFDIVVIFFIVVFLMGWQGLIGVVFMTALLPCVLIISVACAKLRRETAEVSEKRISLMNELVTGIRALKTHTWEEYYEEKVKEVRRSEIWVILKKSTLLSFVQSGEQTSASIATFLSMVSFVLTGHYISTFKAFTVLAISNVLTQVVVTRVGVSAPWLFEVFASLERIESFLFVDKLPLEDNHTSSSQESPYVKPAAEVSLQKDHQTVETSMVKNHEKMVGKVTDSVNLSVSNLKCKLNGSGGDSFLLQDINFLVREKSLTVITGPVGGGKSTLLAAIAGEVVKTSGNIVCPGSVAYMPQSAWVFSGTLRENVLFGEPYEEKKYAEVLNACALVQDINRFPSGDLTFVGEHGVVLSGGQLARVNLARAVYAEADVYLLDDPLSAVDVKVGKHILEQCICKLLRDKIKILVTYAENGLKAADQVVVLHKGCLVGQGTYRELQGDERILDIIQAGSITSDSEDEASSEESEEKERPPLYNKDGMDIVGGDNLELAEEERATGDISFALYWKYFRTGMHPFGLVCLLLFTVFSQVVLVSPNVCLSYLTKSSWNKQQDPTFIHVYVALIVAAVLASTTRACLLIQLLLRSAQALHDRMVKCLLKAPVLFFDTNPAGRILNRCSKDIGYIDEILSQTFLGVIQLIFVVLTALVLPSLIIPWFVVITLPVLAAFVYLAKYFLKSARELKRLEAISRSPVFSLFSETMAGLSTIRTRKKGNDFLEQLYQHQDLHNQAYYMVTASSFWLAVRADLLCSVLITAVAFTFVLYTENPAFIGLSLAYAVQTAKKSQVAVRQFGDIENTMTSVERVLAYANIESEPGYNIKTFPPYNWPSAGHVSFRDVSLRYYPGGPKVLKNLTFDIPEKLKLGIVGRTGDGKSSIVAAILRMPEADGEVVVDDVSIKNIQLQESRKCISVLSQSPVLLSGTLRENLDPLEKHGNYELWKALEDVEMKELVESLEGQLDYELLAKGENLSVGERQLICLARTLLQKNKIVILDEPTASVDPNTEEKIWTTVRDKLKNSTVITIAHRLNTIKDCDIILVLKEGEVAEMDTLDTLLSREDGIFYNMAASQNLLSSLS